MTAVVLLALRIAGITAATLALGGTITAVVLGAVCGIQWFDRAGLKVEPDIEFGHGRDQGG